MLAGPAARRGDTSGDKPPLPGLRVRCVRGERGRPQPPAKRGAAFRGHRSSQRGGPTPGVSRGREPGSLQNAAIPEPRGESPPPRWPRRSGPAGQAPDKPPQGSGPSPSPAPRHGGGRTGSPARRGSLRRRSGARPRPRHPPHFSRHRRHGLVPQRLSFGHGCAHIRAGGSRRGSAHRTTPRLPMPRRGRVPGRAATAAAPRCRPPSAPRHGSAPPAPRRAAPGECCAPPRPLPPH